jgi:uncharacterized membrane protein (UPF0127 family)
VASIRSTEVVVFALVSTAVLLLIAFEAYAGAGPGSAKSQVPSSFTVNGKTYVFNFTATTQSERAAGLMNKQVTNRTTMLFAFPGFGAWSFWMYDTNTSLDIIWLNSAGNSARVVFLVTSAPPCYNSLACTVYTPASAANYVIEAKAGFAAANGITVGTLIELH